MKYFIILLVLVGVITTPVNVFAESSNPYIPTTSNNRTATVDGTDFVVSYAIAGGNLLSLIPDVNASTLIVNINATDGGSITLTLPRELIDVKIGNEDDDFFVLVDGENSKFTETTTSRHRTISVAFNAGAEQIEIIAPPLSSDRYYPRSSSNYFSNPEFKIYKVQENSYEFSIPYKISNAELDRIIVDCDSTAILVYFDNIGTNGNLVINIPRALLDAKIGEQDDQMFFILDQQEVEHQEINTDSESRTFDIPLQTGGAILEIIATNVGMFPEPVSCGVVNGESPYYRLLSPLDQFNSDISFTKIQCKQHLVLIQKYDGTPACVKPETKENLIKRGWTIPANTSLVTKNESYLFKSTNPLGDPINISPVGMPIHFYYNLTNHVDEKYLYDIDFGVFSKSDNVYNNTKSVEVPASKSTILTWEFTPQIEGNYIASVRDNYAAYAAVKHIIVEDPDHDHDRLTVTILSGTNDSDCKEPCISPKVLTIPTDTIVDFINNSSGMHKISTGNVDFGPDDTFHISSDGRFQSPYLYANDTYSFLFLTPGEYKYYSWIHPQISGTIYVVSDDNIENEN